MLFTDFDQKQLSLNDLSGQVRNKFQIEISKQGLDQRFSQRSVDFVKQVMEKLLVKLISEQAVSGLLKDFNSVRIKDSTCFQLPADMAQKYPGSGGNASKAMLRIQFEFDYKTGKIYDLSLHPFNHQDQSNATATVGNIQARDLIIRDLGYININVLSQIISRKAFFLNRLNTAKIYELKDGSYQEINLVKIKRHMDQRNLPYQEKTVYLGEEKRVKTRLIIERMPDNQVKERLRKAEKEARKKKRTLSKEYKVRAALNLFITNLDSEKLPIDQVRSLYRLRWQIELVFKVWKSVGQIHQVKKMKGERLETILYAKLLLISINWFIIWEMNKVFWETKKIQLSPIKVFKTLKNRIYQHLLAQRNGALQMTIFIMELYLMSEKNHRLEKKRNQLSSIEIQMMFCIQTPNEK